MYNKWLSALGVCALLFLTGCTDLSMLGASAQTKFDTTVTTDKEGLFIALAGDNTLDSVTGDLVLPAVGSNGSVITWSSDHPDIIASNGKVTRSIGENDTIVTLTATFAVGDVKVSKTLTVKVKAYTVQEAVADDLLALTEESLSLSGHDKPGAITGNFTLPLTGAAGSTIAWESSNSDVIAIGEGGSVTVKRPAADSGGIIIDLKATLASRSAVKFKHLFVTVLDLSGSGASDEAAATATLALLNADSFSLAAGESVNAIISDFTLPLTGAQGSTIAWDASPSEVLSISVDGFVSVHPRANDTVVDLNARVSAGVAVKVMTSLVTVKAQDRAVTKENLLIAKVEAGAKTQSNYSVESWAALTTALALPENIEQDKIDKAKAVHASLIGLHPIHADLLLASAKTDFQKLAEVDYSTGSWNAVKAALAQSEGSETAVLDKLAAVDTAMEALIPSDLAGALADTNRQVAAIVEINYTPDTYALLSAVKAMPETSETQKLLKARLARKALGGLIAATASDAAIALDTAKSIATAKTPATYTTTSWAILTAALALPEASDSLKAAKATAIIDAVSGLVTVIPTPSSNSAIAATISMGSPTVVTFSKNNSVAQGEVLIITVSEDYGTGKYLWYLDTVQVQGEFDRILRIETTGMRAGQYDLMVVVPENGGFRSMRFSVTRAAK